MCVGEVSQGQKRVRSPSGGATGGCEWPAGNQTQVLLKSRHFYLLSHLPHPCRHLSKEEGKMMGITSTNKRTTVRTPECLAESQSWGKWSPFRGSPMIVSFKSEAAESNSPPYTSIADVNLVTVQSPFQYRRSQNEQNWKCSRSQKLHLGRKPLINWKENGRFFFLDLKAKSPTLKDGKAQPVTMQEQFCYYCVAL